MKTLTDMLNNHAVSQVKTYQKWVDQANDVFTHAQRNAGEYLPARLMEYEDRGDAAIWWGGSLTTSVDLYIHIPWNPVLCDEIALLLGVFGWYVISENEGYTDKPSHKFHLRNKACPKVHINLQMNSGDEGSTCKLVQTGTKVTETPIYEVRCSEGEDF